MEETQPTVSLIARPALDLEGLRAYLDSVGGATWLDRRLEEHGGDPNPGELLVEAAGRACYRSWEPGLNPNVRRVRADQVEYFANVLRSGHGSVLEHANYSFAIRNVSRVFCYDADTEVLTRDGWVPWPKVTGAEEFGTLNPESGELEYQWATERFEGAYSGMLYRVESEQVDLLVTPDHRLWVQPVDPPTPSGPEPAYRVEHAVDAEGRHVRYQKAARWAGRDDGVVALPPAELPAEPFARFLGRWLAEGWTDGDDIVLPRGRGEAVEDGAGLLRALGLDVDLARAGQVRARHDPVRDVLGTCGGNAGERRVPSLVHRWSPRLLRLLLQSYAGGEDASGADRTPGVLATGSGQLADDLQVLAMKTGWSADLHRDAAGGYVVVLDASGSATPAAGPPADASGSAGVGHASVNGSRAQDGWQPYEGTVHCVKVPNGLLFVRRNGKAVVSGNTHELVRHRAGSAFSQESLRFVRLTDIGFRVPPALEPVRDQVVSIVEQLEEFQVSAAEELGIDDEGVPFHVKKEVTSALRRLAPIGLSTDILWTANARTLRHVIEMRTAPGAEEELRLVFDLVARHMVDEAPGLFQDFVQAEDGSWVADHRKV